MSLLNDASLVMIPSGYKDTKLYSVKPTNGDGDFTFSRGSNLAATRVNSEGLIEKGRENRLLQSNNFNTSPYSPANATVTSGFEGYDGSNDAWKVASTTIGSETRIRQSQTFTTGEIISLSVYMKKGNVNFGIVRTYAISGGGRAWFDLENGTVETENSGINGSIEDVGNGWYRCSIWGVIDTTGAVDIAPAPADGDYLADAVGEFIYIQDSQLESGLVATDYIETGATTAQAGILEDMPRLDYSGGATCPSLLLEPQRTNGISNSEYFSGWTALNNVSLTENNTTSPEGKTNATLMSVSGAGSLARSIRIGSQSTSTDKKTMSVFAKANTANTIQLYHSGETQAYVNFDLSSGEVGTSGTNSTGNIEPMGNDWYRCIATFDSGGNFGSSIYIGFATSSSAPYAGGSISDTSLSVYIYGGQYEIGSYPTSYIPTYGAGASVTRGADSCSKTGISSLIGQTEGTLFLDFVYNGKSDLITDNFNLTLGTWSSNVITIGQYNATLYARIYASSVIYFNQDFGVMTIGQRYKCAVAYANNDAVFYVNGSLMGSDTSVVVPATSSISLNRGAYENSKQINQAILFKTRLSNTELAELTTI